jgi:serine/threonine-protein kinase
MLTESEKRAATLAVSRYGADHARVQQAVEAVLQAQGRPPNLLDLFVVQHLLTRAQADEVRAALESTHIDVATAATPANGEPRLKDAGSAVTKRMPKPENGDTEVELRALGDYRILRRLGEGGMGSVYLGYDEAGGRQVAIKVLPDHLADNQALVDRFYREAKSGALLNHPNIVRNLAAGRDRATGKHYLVLEYVDGPSAHALLNRFGRLSVGDAVHIAMDIARALEHAHSRNIVHRDIKPDNILLTRSGVAKLSDLGLAKRTDEASHLTAARQGFGTPYYMPYEQAINARSADGRSDIYALGATLYHLLSGEVPFPGDSHIEVVDKKNLGFFAPASGLIPEVPPVLDRILERMLARDPGDRYQTVSEVLVDLDRSSLATPVLSFVDEDVALQDPLVRARLTAPAQPTSPDLQGAAAEPKPEPAAGNPDLWYLKYCDKRGQWCKARATTQQVVQRLRDGRLPYEVELCHLPRGIFRALAAYPEFKQALAAMAKAPKPRRQKSPGRGPLGRSASTGVMAGGQLINRPAYLLWLSVCVAAGLTALTGIAVALWRGWLTL